MCKLLVEFNKLSVKDAVIHQVLHNVACVVLPGSLFHPMLDLFFSPMNFWEHLKPSLGMI